MDDECSYRGGSVWFATYFRVGQLVTVVLEEKGVLLLALKL